MISVCRLNLVTPWPVSLKPSLHTPIVFPMFVMAISP